MKNITLQKGDFSPTKDLDLYLDNDFNNRIYTELRNYAFIDFPYSIEDNGFYEPVEFFNLLYEQLSLIQKNMNKPTSLFSHLNELGLTKTKLHYLLYYILLFLKENLSEQSSFEKQMDVFFELIENQIEDLSSEIYGRSSGIRFITNSDLAKELKVAKEHYKKLKSPSNKIKYLEANKSETNRKINFYARYEEYLHMGRGPDFIYWCNAKIKEQEDVLEKKEDASEDFEEHKKSTDLGVYTNNQLVLIFYYFFSYLDIDIRTNTSISTVAKFLHLVTGKDFTTVQNSDFNKKLQKAPNFLKSEKKLIGDLRSIRPLFDKVELNEIVKMIDNEIEIANAELNRKK